MFLSLLAYVPLLVLVMYLLQTALVFEPIQGSGPGLLADALHAAAIRLQAGRRLSVAVDGPWMRSTPAAASRTRSSVTS